MRRVAYFLGLFCGTFVSLIEAIAKDFLVWVILGTLAIAFIAQNGLLQADFPWLIHAPTAIPGPHRPPTPAPLPSPTPIKQEWVRVANTDGEGVFLRNTPAMADKVVAWPDGTYLLIVGADMFAEGRLWRRVQDPQGRVGWVPVQYVEDLPN